MTTYKLYIGANNTTKQVEIDKIEQTLNGYFDGYTMEQATGYWLGNREASVVITVASEIEIVPVIVELKHILQQDAIAYQEVEQLHFI